MTVGGQGDAADHGRAPWGVGLRGNITVLLMPTITVKLDKKRAAQLTRWSRSRKIPKSEVIRALIDRAGPIETGADLLEWVNASEGKGLGLKQK